MWLEKLQRVVAVLIAVSLLLPQYSCARQGKTEIYYPLSGKGVDWQIGFVVLFLGPLVLLFIFRRGMAGILGRMALAAVGLYLVSYGVYVVATKLLIGWYFYTLGTLAYLVLSLVELYRRIVQRRKLGRTSTLI